MHYKFRWIAYDMRFELKGGKMEKKHYYGIDWLRTFACIGIVMMHMRGNNSYCCEGIFADTIIPSFTNFVFLFMTISAFGLCVGYYDQVVEGTIKWNLFYKKRYLKILPFFAILVLIDIIMSFSIQSLTEGFANLTLLFGLFPNNISVIGTGWFLGLIFAFYLIFPFFCTLISNKKVAWVGLGVSLILSYAIKYYFGLNYPRRNIVYCLPFFLAGGLVFLYREWLEKIQWYCYLPVTIAGILIYYFVGENVITCLLVSAVLLIQGISFRCKRNKVVSFISDLSMEIYLSHMMIFRIMEKLNLNTCFGNGWLQYVFTLGLVLLGAICYSYIVKKIILIIERKMKNSCT